MSSMTRLERWRAHVSREPMDRPLRRAGFTEDLRRRLVERIDGANPGQYFDMDVPPMVSMAKPEGYEPPDFLPYFEGTDLGDNYRITEVGCARVRGDFYHWCVPVRSHLTFLVAAVESDAELLSGMLNVYFEGQYIGKTQLQEKMPGDEFRLNLGADREVAVKREKYRDKVKETFLGKFERDTVERELGYKITAENVKDRPVRLTVLDRIPVSKTDRIAVKEIRMIPEPNQENYLDRQGVMKWDLQLKPKEKKEIVIEFTVSYPREFVPNF